MKKKIFNFLLVILFVPIFVFTGCSNGDENLKTIQVLANNGEFGIVSGSGKYQENKEVLIEAQAKSGYVFVWWNDGNTSPQRTVVAKDRRKVYTAVFEKGEQIAYVQNDSGKSAVVVENGTITENVLTNTLEINAKNVDAFSYWTSSKVRNLIFSNQTTYNLEKSQLLVGEVCTFSAKEQNEGIVILCSNDNLQISNYDTLAQIENKNKDKFNAFYQLKNNSEQQFEREDAILIKQENTSNNVKQITANYSFNTNNYSRFYILKFAKFNQQIVVASFLSYSLIEGLSMQDNVINCGNVVFNISINSFSN